jgi:hypothetical protein
MTRNIHIREMIHSPLETGMVDRSTENSTRQVHSTSSSPPGSVTNFITEITKDNTYGIGNGNNNIQKGKHHSTTTPTTDSTMVYNDQSTLLNTTSCIVSNKNSNRETVESSNFPKKTSVGNSTNHTELIQQSITPLQNNNPYGDILHEDKSPNTLRLFYKNINGIYKGNTWLQWTIASEKIQQLQIDICGFTETNLKWDPTMITAARQIGQKFGKICNINTSSNSDPCKNKYQPGGTATVVKDRTSGRISSKINDPTKMGRWSGYKLQTNHRSFINILTVYRPPKSEGIHTSYQQQVNELKNLNSPIKDPRLKVLKDLESLVVDFNHKGEMTIIMIDANESLTHNAKSLSTFMADTNLVSLIQHPHLHPPTHTRGTKCIDYIIGSPTLLQYTTRSGITSFYDEPWTATDHRGLFVDFDEIGLFGATVHTPLPPIKRIITSKSRPIIKKFLEAIEKQNTIQSMLQHIQALREKQNWEIDDHDALEQIDQSFTNTLLKAEQSSGVPRQHAWSPTLHIASQIYEYWCIVAKSNTNNINSSTQLQKIASKLPPGAVFQGNPSRNTISQLKHSRKTLIDTRYKSYDLRDEFLPLQYEILLEKGQMSKAKAIQSKKNREQQQRCWKKFQMMRQEGKTAGGISHVLIRSNEATPHRINDKDELDVVLLERNVEHFQQAQGTPFTISPLLDLIGHNGCSNYALQILEGNVPDNIPVTAKKLLKQAKKVRTPIPLEMSLEDMCQGFKKWREQTTTSPSNKHLGIYKALVNAKVYNIRTTLEQSTQSLQPKETRPSVADKCLQIQHLLLELAVSKCHTFTRWKVVHNFLLEKLPGTPFLDKLRVIHLYEADWSLIQKFYVAHKITKIASREGTFPPEQAGGRPGRSAIELAASRTILYEAIRLQRLTGAVVYNDAKACFDRVLENLSNLLLLREGLPKEIALLHAQTFSQIQYYIKHKLGIGPKSHSHLNPHPVHGVGQGATDAPARWGAVGDALIRVYKEEATDANITSPISNITSNQKIAGFVDDTSTLMIIQRTLMLFLILLLEKDTQLWEKLLFTSGGKLEIPKCCFSIFCWTFDNLGRATLDNSKQYNLHVRSSETQEILRIPQIKTSQAYKYVGVELSLDGSMAQQTKALESKCKQMAAQLNQVYMSPRDTKQGYTTVFTPSMRYGLPATSISPTKLYRAQAPLIHIVLPRLGYNRNMPRTLTFASKKWGGLGLLNLATEQGVNQSTLLISHLRAHKYLSKPIITLLESYQVSTGMTTNPLEDTTPQVYVQSPWIESIREFLRTSQATIRLPRLQTLRLLREYDHPIMKHHDRQLFTKSELEAINACRLYLRVTTMAEITNGPGTHILECALNGRVDKQNNPLLWQSSTSKIRWPTQDYPPRKAWRYWKKFLQTYTTNSHCTLINPLGQWTQQAHTQRIWNYVLADTHIIHCTPHSKTVYEKTLTRSRQVDTYVRRNDEMRLNITESVPVIPESHTEVSIKCKKQIQTFLQSSDNTHKGQGYYYHTTLNTSNTVPSHRIYIATRGSITHQKTILRAVIDYGSRHTNIIGIIQNDPYHSVFTAEAFSILAALHHVVTSNVPPQSCVRVCVNNPSLARQINTRLSRPTKEQNTLSHDWDLIELTCELAKKFPNIQVFSQHQTTDDNLLDLDERLFSAPKDEINTISRTTHQFNVLPIIQAPVLLIDNTRVSGDYATALRDCTNKDEVKTYYQEKYGWNQTTQQSIDWRAHGKAICQLSQRQQKTITQFIHGWLPTNAAHGQQRLDTGRLCPFCRSCDESQIHFLQCTHPQATANWNDAAARTEKKLRQYNKNVDHRLIKLITTSITLWRTTSHPEIPITLPVKYHQLFHAQSRIGWDHIIKGRFANEWQHALDTQTEGNTRNWVTYCIRITLLDIFEVWKLRCDQEHGTNQEDTRQRALARLTPQVARLFEQRKDIDQSDAHLFSKSEDDILIAPTAIIENWIFKTSLRVRDSIRRRRMKEKNTIRPIHPYFTQDIPQKQKVKQKGRQSINTQLRPTMITQFFHTHPHSQPKQKNDLKPP